MTTQVQGPSGGQPDSSNLEASIDAVGAQVRQMQETYAAMRRQMLLFTLAIVAVIVIFGGALTMAARENLSVEKIQAAAATKAQQAWPEAQKQMIIALGTAAPVYQKLAFERFQAVLPTLETKVNSLAQTLPKQIGEDMQSEAEGMFKRVSQKLEDDLQKEFPKLDHEKLVKLGDQFKDEMAVAGGKLRDHLQQLYSDELKKIEATLQGFPVDQYASMNNDTLSRLLAHNFLMLVDYEVQVVGTPDGLDHAAQLTVK